MGLGGIGATSEAVDEEELDEEMTLVFLEREASEGAGCSGWLTAPELVSTYTVGTWIFGELQDSLCAIQTSSVSGIA